MALVINHNLGSKKALNLLEKNQTALGKDLKAAASGLKIKDASDGASEFAISRRLAIEERGLGQDIQNVKTGGDLLAVAEGGIRDAIETLRDMKKLAINAANDTNTDADRATIEKEFAQRMDTITDIAATTNYNGKLLLAGDYYRPFNRMEKVTRYITETKTVTVGPPSVQYVPGANGAVSIVQSNKVANMTSAFSSYDSSTKQVTNLMCNDPAKTTCPVGFVGSIMKVTVDFSGGTVSGNPANISDFDQQGFSLLCGSTESWYNQNRRGGCEQYINIKFDSSKLPSQSEHSPQTLSNRSERVDYTIGIKNVNSVADLPAALFQGFAASNSSKSSNTVAFIHNAHGLAMMTDGTSYYFYKTGNGLGILDDGIILTQTNDPSVTPGVEIITGPTQKTFVTSSLPYTTEEEVYHTGNPLVIHDSTRASNAIHVFIDSMHPRAITGKVPMRDPNTWEIIAQRDSNTGEIMKDSDGNPIPAAYIDPAPTLEDAHVITREKALQAIDILDMAVNYALGQITDIGAYRMRLEQDEGKITVQQESVIGSKSTIQDADMAAIMTNFRKNSVLTQSAQLMLAQSNQNASRVLSLLQ